MQHSKRPLDPPRIPLAGPSSSSRLSRRPISFSDPSSGLLALLITVAGSSSVDGRPHDSGIPPDFLCPRLHTRSSAQSPSYQDTASVHCDNSQSTKQLTTPAPIDLSVRQRKKRVRRTVNIADKYVQSSDGRWRKADSWQLYGSSSCAATQCMDATPTEVPVQDDQVAASAVSSVSVSTVSSASTDPTLPHGWGGGKAEDDMTGIILGLSLSLAFALIAFMIGVVLWRRKRWKHEKDSEKTAVRIDTPDIELSEEAQRVRFKQRLWQRAAVKWKANVKHSARRRRKRGTTRPPETDPPSDGPTMQASTSAVSLTRIQTVSDGDSGYTAWPLSIREGDPVPQRSRSPSIAPSDSGVSTAHNAGPFVALPSQPPAYIPNPSFRQAYSMRHLSSSDSSGSQSSSKGTTPGFALGSSPLSCEPPFHSAHVATDDKAVLAQMARMASAPPVDEPPMTGARGGLSEVQPSVPVLDEDPYERLPPEIQLGDDTDGMDAHATRQGSSFAVTHDIPTATPCSYLGPDTHPTADDDIDSDVPSYAEDAIRHPTLVLPSPPSKVPLAGPMFYEYPHEFEEDVACVEPPNEPSSPPFEEPSTLPFATLYNAHMIAPSAPPLEIEEDPLYVGVFGPSAPPLDDIGRDLGPPSSIDSSALSTSRGEDSSGSACPGQTATCGDDALPPQYLP